MPRNFIEMAQLVDSNAQGNAYFKIELRCFASEMIDQKIKLQLAAQTPEDDFRSQAGFAGIEIARYGIQKIGGEGSARGSEENVKCDLSGGLWHRWYERQATKGDGLSYLAYNRSLDIEKTLLRKVGEAIQRFDMIREGDRIAVGLSGGKDSVTLLEALLLLQKRAPIHFSVCAFTIEQGKFLRPIQPFGEYLKARGVDWTYFHDKPSFTLLNEQPDHGCDLCSRYRRRAVYEVARGLGANVVALGHTADDFCESFLRNALFTGRLSALPPMTWSAKKEFRLIRPLVYVTEAITAAYAASLSAPVIPCGCSQKSGTVRRSLRDFLGEMEKDHPRLKESLLTAMGNIDPDRLLDPRFRNADASYAETEGEILLPVLTNL